MKLRICLLFLLSANFLIAQEKDKEWDVSNPPGEYENVEFTVDEGTWMNLDLSPDGNEIVFDILGDIYIMPASGGTAKAIREGLPYEVQPRFSPDGTKISFTSDAGGGDNIWIMDKDGSNAKQLTKEDFRLLNNAIWTPDGEYLIARKHFTSTRSLGAGELWMYHITGGSGIQLTKRKNDQQDLGEPSISSDGRYVYYSEDMYPGGYFQYNKDPNDQIYVTKRYDREEGKTETIAGGPGGACRPQVSNDGKTLAFVKRVRTKSTLFLQDLETGEEWPIFDGLSKDQQEAWAIFGVYTNYAWTPDDKHIIIWGGGKIWKVDVEKATSEMIPFTVNAKHKMGKTIRYDQHVSPDEFTAKVIRHAVTSPSGKYMVFNAIGKIWKKELPNGAPSALLDNKDYFQFEPAFSPNGRHLVFVSWSDQDKGAIWKIDMSVANPAPVKLTKHKGIYRTPSYSPDGQSIVFHKENGNIAQGYSFTKDAGLYIIPANGGERQLVTKSGSKPVFSANGKRIFFQTGGGLSKKYKSIKLNGSDERVIFNAKYARQFTPSPDNKWIAFSELYKVYITPMPKTGKPIDLNKGIKSVPVAQVARDAGINLHWSSDSKKLHWTLGEEYFSAKLRDRFMFVENAADSIPPIDTAGLKIGLTIKTDKPSGFVAFTNARIITVDKDNTVIENGTVLVNGNKIEAIGKASDVSIPRNAITYDCNGKTIMPGFVDVHAHLWTFRLGLSPQKEWSYYANLAYGITTTHDPSSNTEMVFAQSELVKSGEMVGPRIFSTGTILYGADGDFKAVVNNLEDARSAMRRMKAYGAFSVKSYNQPRRDQRQQVLQAARELEMIVVPEGGSFFFHNMSMVADGHTGVEHNIPVVPLYDDVIKFWSSTDAYNTPTLVVNYGGINGEYYWYQHTNVWEKERLLRFTPRAVIDSRARHRTMIPEEEYEIGHILTAKSCKKLEDAGVKINLGSHGQLQGLAAHWEFWMFVQGGMTNMQALRAATMNGAEYIGMDKEIGSLEKGKLADMIVLDKNPLDDIYNTEFVKYTMVNGRLYDAETMNEIGNRPLERGKFYWENNRYSKAFEYHEETRSFGRNLCGCTGH
ncbi:MAG: amidohydrolase family protein [Bacteroidota bacterium]